ncbi:MAG: hypothetical protein ACRC8S_04970 [Fimbriiglobus sp.]
MNRQDAKSPRIQNTLLEPPRREDAKNTKKSFLGIVGVNLQPGLNLYDAKSLKVQKVFSWRLGVLAVNHQTLLEPLRPEVAKNTKSEKSFLGVFASWR